MSDLREWFQELADVAASHGRTPGPQAALRGARQRRRHRVIWIAVLVAMIPVTVGVDWLIRPVPVAPTATTTSTTLPLERRVMRLAGSPEIDEQRVQVVARAVTATCQGGAPAEPMVLVAGDKDHDRTWLVVAKPPRPGEHWVCWASGLFGPGFSGISGKGNKPLTPLQATGTQDRRSGNQYWGQVVGIVTKSAALVRVLFDSGIPPLELEPIQAGDRFPVNFYGGFYRPLANDKGLTAGHVIRVVAYDKAGRKVAECQVKDGPGQIC